MHGFYILKYLVTVDQQSLVNCKPTVLIIKNLNCLSNLLVIETVVQWSSLVQMTPPNGNNNNIIIIDIKW